MQRLEVSCAVRHIYIYIRRLRVRKFSRPTWNSIPGPSSPYRLRRPSPRLSFVPVDVGDCVTRRENACQKQLATGRNCQCPNFSQSCCVQQNVAFKNSEYLCELFLGGGRGEFWHEGLKKREHVSV
jgi:hypothetical protein